MTLIRTVTTRQYCASERDAGRRDYEKNLYESDYEKNVKEKNRA